VPCVPDVGAIEVSVGAGTDASTVNVWVLLVPPGVVTLTVWAPVVALDAIVQVALTEVAVGVPLITQVTPVPLTFTARRAGQVGAGKGHRGGRCLAFPSWERSKPASAPALTNSP